MRRVSYFENLSILRAASVRRTLYPDHQKVLMNQCSKTSCYISHMPTLMRTGLYPENASLREITAWNRTSRDFPSRDKQLGELAKHSIPRILGNFLSVRRTQYPKRVAKDSIPSEGLNYQEPHLGVPRSSMCPPKVSFFCRVRLVRAGQSVRSLVLNLFVDTAFQS